MKAKPIPPAPPKAGAKKGTLAEKNRQMKWVLSQMPKAHAPVFKKWLGTECMPTNVTASVCGDGYGKVVAGKYAKWAKSAGNI